MGAGPEVGLTSARHGARPAGRPLRIVWAYDRDHLRHPFIVIGLTTLVGEGHAVTVIASDRSPSGAYTSNPAYSFEAREARWTDVSLRLQAMKKQRHRLIALAQAEAQSIEDGGGLSKLERWRRSFRRWRLERQARAVADQRERTAARERRRKDSIDTWIPYLRGFFALMSTPCDVIIASRPQAAVWACLAARLRGKRFVYFPFELYGEQAYAPMPLLLRLERLMLRWGVDAVITQNKPRAEVYEAERGSRVTPFIVHNYKPIRAFRPEGRLRTALNIPADKRIVLYEGLLVEGRWLEHVAEAVALLDDDTVLVMMGKNTSDWLNKAAASLEAPLKSGRLVIAPSVPHDILLDYVVDADAGVIIYDDSIRNNFYCEPGKLSDYIAVGVPVVAPDFPTIGPVVRDYGIGACFEGHTPEAIAATIRSVLARPKAEWAPALERAVRELTWDTQAPQLLAAVSGGAPARG